MDVYRIVARAAARGLLLFLLMLSVEPAAAQDHPADSISVRVVTYNIAGGRFGSVDSLAATLAQLAPDVVALQEVASNWEAVSQSVDQAEALGLRLGMESFYAPIYTVEDDTLGTRRFGLALLTRHPVVQRQDHPLTRLSTQDETPTPRPMPGFPEIVVRVGEVEVRVFSTHLDFRRDPSVRQEQVREMLGVLGDLSSPTLLLGDLNARPDAPEIAPLLARLGDAWQAGTGPGWTGPVRAPDRRIDYVLFSEHCRVRHAFVDTAATSDHFAVVADLRCAP